MTSREQHPSAALRPDQRIACLAREQHGVVARWQLLEGGVSAHVIDNRVRSSRLLVLYRGVYRVGPAAAYREAEMAAVLAGGRSAAISHRSACVLHRLVPRPEDGPKIEVRVPPDRRPRARGVRFHRMRPLEPDEITTVESVRVTTPARSLIDLAGVSPRAEVERALARAIRKKMLDGRDLLAQLSREPRRAGVGILRAMLGAGGPNPSFTRSEAEARLLAVIRRARLGVPEVNVAVLGYEVDFLWRAEKLVVEVDGRAFHSSEGAFERDRRRDRHFAAHGHQVLRVTWRQITREPERLVGELGMALGFARSALR